MNQNSIIESSHVKSATRTQKAMKRIRKIWMAHLPRQKNNHRGYCNNWYSRIGSNYKR